MSKYTHTPGPWMIYEDGMIGSASVRRFPDMTVLKPGAVKGENIGTAMANARLIASAPELLEALKLAHNIIWRPGCECLSCEVESIRAAIAKATAEVTP